jgi:hypothetical protein
MEINNTAVAGESQNVGELMSGAQKVASGLILTTGSTMSALGMVTTAVGMAASAVAIVGEIINMPASLTVSSAMAKTMSQNMETLGGYGMLAIVAGVGSVFAGSFINLISQQMNEKYKFDNQDHSWMDFKATRKNILAGIQQMREGALALGNPENKTSNKMKM